MCVVAYSHSEVQYWYSTQNEAPFRASCPTTCALARLSCSPHAATPLWLERGVGGILRALSLFLHFVVE